MSIYVLFGCSIVVVIFVMWGNCVLGSFLRIWVVLIFDLPIIVILGITLRLFIRGLEYSDLMLCIYTVPRGDVIVL
jgi:hypothetical protein